ncbi:BLUF domain-containing protein [Rhodobacteraceae bacterium N5(2021)]|uniref:BLUF domain-containing protein n=1 Tax=Gymnodinialimonas phycosphaerae TaxID=2841589 RepID=A0A975TZ11_9RHOB|nr:BLUF domain-containing protein [Gymnodinialimonas phycosphaerae]MBY4893117.1 BLUF domain-containing protein [Gymnodinialimonas phycosphaerae]
MAHLSHLIYTSVPFGYDPADLNGILLDARAANTRDGVTGALICRRDVFMQYLEGPSRALSATYARIKRDDRHVEVVARSEGPIDTRLFGDWAMLHDPAQSLIWSVEEVEEGQLERAGAHDYQRMFQSLAAKALAP